jgi:hypothetical protein
MKKYAALFLFMALCTTFFSFSEKRGGDVFAIYLNGKQVHQQFVHADKSVKTLSLHSLSENDKIEVFYSHCGQAGKNRVITIRNEKNEAIKKMVFGDGKDNRARMGFFRKDIPKTKSERINLFYSSAELPDGRLLATIVWNEGKVIAKL